MLSPSLLPPCLRRTAASVAVVTSLIIAAPSLASAATLEWNFSAALDNGEDASGIFVTQNVPTGGPYLITSIVDGVLGTTPITLLPVNGFAGNNNELYTTNPYLDGFGISFVTSTDIQYNLYNSGSYHWASPDATGLITAFTVAPITAPPIPEADTLALLASGLVALALIRRRAV